MSIHKPKHVHPVMPRLRDQQSFPAIRIYGSCIGLKEHYGRLLVFDTLLGQTAKVFIESVAEWAFRTRAFEEVSILDVWVNRILPLRSRRKTLIKILEVHK